MNDPRPKIEATPANIESIRRLLSDVANEGKQRDNARDAIEVLIDRYGLAEFLSLAGSVCFAKSCHLAEHWQDKTSANAWKRAGDQLDKTSGTVAVRTVS